MGVKLNRKLAKKILNRLIPIKKFKIAKDILKREMKKKKKNENTKLKRWNMICSLVRTIANIGLNEKEIIMITDITKVIKIRNIISIRRTRKSPRKDIVIMVVVQGLKTHIMLMKRSTKRNIMTNLFLSRLTLMMIKSQVNLSDTRFIFKNRSDVINSQQ